MWSHVRSGWEKCIWNTKASMRRYAGTGLLIGVNIMLAEKGVKQGIK